MYTTTPDIRSVYQSLRHGRPDGLDPSTKADLTADDTVQVMLRDHVHNVIVDATFDGNADQPIRLSVTPTSAAPTGQPVRLQAVTVSRLNALLKGTVGLEVQFSARTQAHNLRTGAYRTCALADGLTASTERDSATTKWTAPVLSGGVPAPVAPKVTATLTPEPEPQPTPVDVVGRVPSRDESAIVLSRANLRKYEAVRQAHKANGHRTLVALRGPAGSGKTMAARHFAASEGLPFFKFDCAGVRDPDGWFGTWATTPGANGSGVGLEFRASDLLKAITLDVPAVLLLDEANRAAGNAVVALNPLLDLSGTITVPQTGRSVDINPHLQVLLTFNLGTEYMHTEPLDTAFQDRMGMTLKIPHLSQNEERKLLLKRVPGLSAYHADVLTQLGALIREAAAHGGKHRSVSTRRLLDAAHYMAAGLRPLEAVEGAIIDWYDDEGGARSEQSQVRQHMVGLIWDDPANGVAVEPTDEDGLATGDLVIDTEGAI